MKISKFLFSMLAVLSLLVGPMVPASAQVFDPLSKSAGGSMSGRILWVGPPPAVTGTGTPTITAASTNIAGIVTAGASATSVIITFNTNQPFTSVPSCVVTSQTQLAAFAWVTTALTITITQTATSGNIINYRCDPTS